MNGVSFPPTGLGVSPAVPPRINQANHHQDPRFEVILQKIKLEQQLTLDDLDSAQQLIGWQAKRIEKLKQNIDIYEEKFEVIADNEAKKDHNLERLKTDKEELSSSNKDLIERIQKLEKIPDQLDKAHSRYEKMKKEKEELVEFLKKLRAIVEVLKKQNTSLTAQLNNNTDICSQTKVFIGKLFGCLSRVTPVQELLKIEDVVELEEKKNPLAIEEE